MQFRFDASQEHQLRAIEAVADLFEATTGDRVLYDHVACDSGVERTFLQDLEQREDVKLLVKLPGWFTVPTPVGEYNPDWAIVLDREGAAERVFLVRETKGEGELRPTEAIKINCGRAHFSGALAVDYTRVTEASQVM
jgi:type III restriction enzyme